MHNPSVATWATVKELGRILPEVEDSTWHKTPSLKVRKRSFVRLRERDVIVVLVDLDEKEALIAAEPHIFFQTPHYEGYPAVLVRLSRIDREELKELLIESWRRVAPRQLVREFDTAHAPPIAAGDIVRQVEHELKRAGTPERAAGEKRYLKSDLHFIGASVGDIRRVITSVAKNEPLEHDDLIALVQALWTTRVFELRMAAAMFLEIRALELDAGDLEMIERLLRDSRTWALVDVLAGNVVGALRHPVKRKLDRWAKDDDFWIRRSSLLAELKPLKQGSPFEPFARRADAMLDETEFFIRKAIGWVLREMAKKRPDEVYDWIAPRTHRASGVTMREVVKYLQPDRAAWLMRAYKDGRPAG